MPVPRRRIDRTRQKKGPSTKTPPKSRRHPFAAQRGDATGSTTSSGYNDSDDDDDDDKNDDSDHSSAASEGDEDEACRQEDAESHSSAADSSASDDDLPKSRKRPPQQPSKRRESPRRKAAAATTSKQQRKGTAGDESDRAWSDEGTNYSFQDDSQDEDFRDGQDSDEDGDDEEDEGSGIDSSDSASLRVKKPAKGRRRAAPTMSESEFEGDDDDDASSECSVAVQATKLRRVVKRGRPKKDESDASSDDETDFGTPSRRRKPTNNTRIAAQRKNRLNTLESSDDEIVKPSPQRRKAKSGGDEGTDSKRRSRRKVKFPEINEEKSGDELPRRRDPSIPAALGNRKRLQVPVARRQGSFDVGDSDSEDSHLERAGSAQKRTRLSPLRNKKAKRPSAGSVRDAEIGDSEDSSSLLDGKARHVTQEGDLYLSDDSSNAAIQQAAENTDSPPRTVCRCTSEFDAITEEDLPSRHVCLVSPDGSSKHCFALETLRQVALTSSHPKTDINGKLTFLQPLHFRTAMSDDLLDQIASRFGRDALDLTGPFYNGTIGSIDGVSFNPPSFSVYEEETFRTTLRRFVRSVMGRRDLYVCPLCYTIACSRVIDSRKRKSAVNRRRDSKQDISEVYSADFQEDPMYVLGSLDNEALGVAATFCFRSAKQVESHLQQDHQVTPRKEDNGIYVRYMIRKQDGLVQRFIHAVEGNIMEYWLGGCNFEFVHLLENVDKVEMYRFREAGEEISDSGDCDEADMLAKGEQYFRSFRHDAEALWDSLSAPYSTRNDVGDFVVEDGAEANDGVDEARLAHLEFMRDSMEDEMEEDRRWVARLEEQSEKKEDEMDSYEDEMSEEDDQDDEESSEDEWLAKKRKSIEARRAKGKERTSKQLHERESGSSSDPFDSEEDSNSTSDELPQTNRSYSKSMKRKSIEDSDDE